ncbi:MAG: hypothetical protein U0M06_00845 [Clostridia bacterium]|nr:hypothetical protein [Clostridia bacterium]
MNKDITVNAMKYAVRIWREIKKPKLVGCVSADLFIESGRDDANEKKPRFVLSSDIKVTLVYLILALAAMKLICSVIRKIF